VRRQAVVAGLSLLPAMFWTPYFALHGFAVCFACLLVVTVLGPRIDFPRRLAGLVVAPWIGAVVLYVGVGLLSSFSDSPDRPLSDFYDQSAHPLMFVLPGFASTWRDGMTQTLVEQVPRAAFVNLYLGLSVIVLGAIGGAGTLGPWIAGRLRDRPSPQALAALLALATVVVCGICSLPPRVFHGSIPMPALLIHEVAPGLRAGQRFVMPLMAGTAVLAGLGTNVILRRLPRVALTPAVLAIALLVALDLWATPPGMPTEAPPRSPALDALSNAPDGPVIDIMPQGFLGTPSQNACMLQLVHHKPLVNTCGFVSPPDKLWKLGLLPMCEVLTRLRQRGLRYVLIEPLPAPPNVTACFRGQSRLGPWRALARDRYMSVYELLPARS
jgi:hypothetical protein